MASAVRSNGHPREILMLYAADAVHSVEYVQYAAVATQDTVITPRGAVPPESNRCVTTTGGQRSITACDDGMRFVYEAGSAAGMTPGSPDEVIASTSYASLQDAQAEISRRWALKLLGTFASAALLLAIFLMATGYSPAISPRRTARMH